MYLFISEIVNETSTAASLALGSCTVEFKQLYMSKLRVQICSAWLFQTSTVARFLSTSVRRLVYFYTVHKYNLAKHSVYTTSLNKMAVAHSTLL